MPDGLIAEKTTKRASPWLRIGNPLDWPSVDQCLLISGVVLPVIVFYALLTHYIFQNSELAPFMDRAALVWVSRYERWGLIPAWGSVLFYSLWVKWRKSSATPLVYLTCQLYAVGFFLYSYAFGYFTSSYSGILSLAGVIVGFLLFDRRPVYLGIASYLGLLVVTTIAEQAGYLRYAPAMVSAPFAHGKLSSWWLYGAGLPTVVAELIVITMVANIVQRWRLREEVFRQLARIDPLTGIANRRGFEERLSIECKRARRSGGHISVLMCDVDYFKDINDGYGHPIGDLMLYGIATVLRQEFRNEIDLCARIGGDEFAILLPETGAQPARQIANRLLAGVRSLSFPVKDRSLGVTISIGVATQSGQAVAPDALLELADGLLYRAKAAGRNQLVCGDSESLAISDKGTDMASLEEPPS